MTTIASVTLVANVGRIDDVVHFEGGKSLASFSAAVSRTFKKQGETVQETDWYTVKTNNPALVTMISEHIKKGDQLIAIGTLSHKIFRRQNGEQGMAIELWADKLYYNISKKTDNADSSQQSEYSEN